MACTITTTKKLRRFGLALALLALQGMAMAEIPASTAEALMRKSGMWAQLSDLSEPLKAEFAQPGSGAQLAREDVQRLQRLAGQAFAPDRLRETALQVLARDVTPAQAADALKWYDSPTGQQITRLEEAATAQFGEQALLEGNAVLGKASGQRVQLLSQIVKATHAAQAMVNMQINTAAAVFQGMANVLPPSAMPHTEDLLKGMESKRPQMEASAMGISLSLLALTYQSASDKALAQYLKFLSSRSGAVLALTMNEAVDKAAATAAKRLGQGMPNLPGSTEL